MRHFHANLYKNLVWVYLCVLCCFAYGSMLGAIPDHVYLQEGEELTLDQKLPVELAVSSAETTVMADVGESTFQALQERNSCGSCENLEVGDHAVACYLFGVIPIKQVEVSVVSDRSLYAGGQVVGIYGATQGVLVLGTSPVEKTDGSYAEPAEHIVREGDYITEVNGQQIEKKEELVELIDRYGDEPLVLTLWRGEEQIDVSVNAIAAKDGTYMIGVWVKDDMAGIGTLTYYEANRDFGALGHGIGDGKTGDLLRLSSGRLYRAEVLGIQKGVRGEPGELQGVVYYGEKNQIGEVVSNTDIGIYGKMSEDYFEELCKEDGIYPVGYKQDVTCGAAAIISNASGELGIYHITIDSLDYSLSDRNKGIHFHVDDEELLDLTGGIVQGLSGSPIIQDGKIVGAVTHVLVNDPTRGYGIFIENMLEH